MESQSCLSTAMVFFHKYFLFKKAFSHDYTKYLTCCTCVFLSLKVSNLIVPLEKVIETFLFLYFRENYLKLNINEKLISEISNKIFQIEFEVLNAIGFDLNVDLPYKYIYVMKPYFEESFNAQFYSKYILIVTSFINDSFKIPICLYYDPLLIFLACVFLVEIYFAIQLKDKAEKKWFQLIDETVQFKEIEEISAKIKMIYDYSNSVNSAKGLLSQTSSSLSLVVPEAKDAKGANKDEKRFVIEFDPPAACDNGIGDTHYQQCDRKFNFFRSKSLINKDNKDGSEAEGLSNNITNNSNNDGDRQFKNYNCKIKQSRYNNDEFNDINIAAKFSCSSNSKEHCISGDCSMNPDIIIEEETAQKDDLNKLTNSNQIKDDCQKNEMKSADYLFLKQNNYNNNNSMSITAIFDHVPAMTSLDRWTEKTYGNTPIISNRTIVDMASHVVWLVSRGCPRCYSFTTTTYYY